MAEVTDDLFRFTSRWAEVPGLPLEAVQMLEERDRELEDFLERWVREPTQQISDTVSSLQFSGSEQTLASFTTPAYPYARRILVEGHVFITGAATTAGVLGDIWELRIKRDGANLQRTRHHNQLGSSWQQTVSAMYRTSISADTAHTWDLTLVRVGGSGGCRSFLDGTTNQFAATTWAR